MGCGTNDWSRSAPVKVVDTLHRARKSEIVTGVSVKDSGGDASLSSVKSVMDKLLWLAEL